MSALQTIGNVPAEHLRFGDLISAHPKTGEPVTWRLVSDPTWIDNSTRYAFGVATDGAYGDQLEPRFERGDLVSAQVTPARAAALTPYVVRKAAPTGAGVTAPSHLTEVPLSDDLPANAPCPTCGKPDVPVNKDGGLRKHGSPVRCTGSGTKIGAARIPRRARNGYYTCPITDDQLRSVTTIIGHGMPKPALTFWAGNLVAETALDNLPKLNRASFDPDARKEAYDWLRKAHVRKKDERGHIGDAAHKIIETKILKQPIPEAIRNDPEMRPYLEHFEQFVQDWQVTFTASEMVVADYDERFAGTLDYLLKSPLLAAALGCHPDEDILGDTKTGGELDERTSSGDVYGVYPEAGVQMSAYRKAKYGWLRDGTRVVMPARHSVGVVLHLRPEGYRLYPVNCGDEVFEAFKFIRGVADWATGPSKGVVGNALQLPTVRKAA
ncbi:hypothetical protein EDD29_0147 [Actinocorallia herbida]|uniref:Uncharacterized protein n=1 Tax=Actinocorallia herbida TaxID=58109 RepID=A0A3N1CMV2_9ACTN|nr:hypothetical protein [Actinocorallia herbida]ROO82525.1 hypothetical protein EDD29_0005 [Actinocorallia herbida]ROO82666.1 hypothetical protein EDD29_0147 [Actinocorallia herbida]